MRLLVLLAAVAAVVVIVVMLVGGEESPQDAARQTAEDFAAAVEAGDAEAACALLAEELRSSFGGDSCAESFSASVSQAGDELEVEITSVRVSGPKAVAETEVTSAMADEPRQSSLELLEDDGKWRVSSLGAA